MKPSLLVSFTYDKAKFEELFSKAQIPKVGDISTFTINGVTAKFRVDDVYYTTKGNMYKVYLQLMEVTGEKENAEKL